MFLKSRIFKLYAGPILSGLMIGSSYIPSLPWALGFALVPLWMAVLKPERSLREVFISGWMTQFLLSLIGFHWIYYVSREFGYMPKPVALVTLLLFAAAVHLYIPVAVTLGVWLRNRFALTQPATLIVFACLHVLGEIYWPSLFPWNLGYPMLWVGSDIAQTADLWGFQGISLIVHLINVIVALTLLKLIPAKKSLAAIALILISLTVLGKFQKSRWLQSDQHSKILQVQANIGNLEKMYAEKGAGFQQHIANEYFALTRQALQVFPDTHLVVWPESAYPDALNSQHRDRRYTSQFFKFLGDIKKPILTGAYSEEISNTQQRREYNGLFLMSDRGEELGKYHKTYLLAFGEYTPFVDWIPILAKYSPAGVGFRRGDGPKVLNWGEIKLGPQICYESLYPEFSANLVKQGAQILVNLTNDSWFGPYSEPKQHMIMTLARAIEMRRPLVRSTNTGITTAITASGDILEQSPIMQTWFHQYHIGYRKNPSITFYVRIVHLLGPLILLLIGLVLWKGRKNA